MTEANTQVSPEQSDMAMEHLEEGTDLGAIHIHNNVIAVITRLAALKVPGVVELGGSLVDDLAGMLSKKAKDRGIRVQVEENTVAIEVHVIIEYGVGIPKVGWQLQNDIRHAVEEMTGKQVKVVDVVVQGVRVPGEAKHHEPEELAS